jgi:hypothetical protein
MLLLLAGCEDYKNAEQRFYETSVAERNEADSARRETAEAEEEDYYAAQATQHADMTSTWEAEGRRQGVQAGCDTNYGRTSGSCVPNDRDYDCAELHALGIGDVEVVGEDWQRLDGWQDFSTGEWIAIPDGLGCEWSGE